MGELRLLHRDNNSQLALDRNVAAVGMFLRQDRGKLFQRAPAGKQVFQETSWSNVQQFKDPGQITFGINWTSDYGNCVLMIICDGRTDEDGKVGHIMSSSMFLAATPKQKKHALEEFFNLVNMDWDVIFYLDSEGYIKAISSIDGTEREEGRDVSSSLKEIEELVFSNLTLWEGCLPSIRAILFEDQEPADAFSEAKQRIQGQQSAEPSTSKFGEPEGGGPNSNDTLSLVAQFFNQNPKDVLARAIEKIPTWSIGLFQLDAWDVVRQDRGFGIQWNSDYGSCFFMINCPQTEGNAKTDGSIDCHTRFEGPKAPRKKQDSLNEFFNLVNDEQRCFLGRAGFFRLVESLASSLGEKEVITRVDSEELPASMEELEDHVFFHLYTSQGCMPLILRIINEDLQPSTAFEILMKQLDVDEDASK